MKLSPWKDIRARKFSPDELQEIDREVEAEFLEMDDVGRADQVALEAREERQRFLELADRLTRARDQEEQSRLKEELARMTFGE